MSPLAQYGAITSLTLLGPDVLCDIHTPWPQRLWDQLDILSTEKQEGMVTLFWAAIRRAGATIVNHWLVEDGHHSTNWELYGQLYSYYGPSLVQEIRLLSPGFCLERGVVVARQTKLRDTPGRMRLSKLQVISRQKGEARTEELGEDRDNIKPILTASLIFDYLADMGVPSDIFEHVADMNRRDSMMVVAKQSVVPWRQVVSGGRGRVGTA